jgi:adenylate cyclase
MADLDGSDSGVNREGLPTGKYSILLFDGFRVIGPDGAVGLGTKPRGLLAVLSSARGRPVPRERLCALFWGSYFEPQAQQNLRQALARIRRSLGEVLAPSAHGIALHEHALQSDLAAFEDRLRIGTPDALEEALAIYGKGLGAELPIREEDWREWLRAESARLEMRALDARVSLAQASLAQGDQARAVAHAEAAIAMDPYREDAHRLLFQALADAGRRAEALRRYDALVETLSRQLGVAPDPATRATAEAIRAGPPRRADPRPRPPPDDGARLVSMARQALGRDRPATLVAQASETSLSTRVSPMQGRLLAAGADRVRLSFGTVREAIGEAFALRSALGDGRLRLAIHSHGERDAEEAKQTAERLCSLVEPGSLALSAEAHEQITTPLDAEVEDLGELGTRPGETPLRAFRVVARGTAEGRRRPAGAVDTILPAVAVLPFTVQDADPAHAFLGEAVADEVIVALSHSNEVSVISRLSTSPLRARGLRPQDIRDLLDARYVLSGTLYPVGDAVRLVPEFADARSGTVVWSDSITVAADAVLGENGIANQILAKLVASILRIELRRVAAPKLSRLDDCTLLIGAIALIHQVSPQKMEQAEAMLLALADRAPGYAAPHAWLAMAHVLRASQGWAGDLGAEAEHALASAQRALDAEPDCSLALAVDAHVQTHFRRRFDLAEERFALAVEANPNDSLAWLLKSTLHTFRAEGAQAVETSSRALRLSPLDPRRWYYDSLAASAAVAKGDYARAIALARASIRGNRLHASTFRALAIALALDGRVEDARAAAAELMRLQPDLTVSGYRSRHPSGATAAGALWADALRIAGIPA